MALLYDSFYLYTNREIYLTVLRVQVEKYEKRAWTRDDAIMETATPCWTQYFIFHERFMQNVYFVEVLTKLQEGLEISIINLVQKSRFVKILASIRNGFSLSGAF
jgi:hypothetical protein